MEIFTRYEGKLLSVEEAPAVIEGTWTYTRTVLLEFPSEESESRGRKTGQAVR
jgi:uncharacterized protein (DUF1330 family)